MLVALLVLAAQISDVPRPVDIKPVAVSGTLQLASDDGALKSPHEAVITVWFRHSLAWHPQDIHVIDGAWSAKVPFPCIAVDIGRIVADGNEAHIPQGSWPDDPARASIALVAGLASKVSLTVLDAATEVPIAEFEVREWSDEWHGYMVPLGDDQGWVVPHSSTGLVQLPAWSLDPNSSFVPGVRWTPQRTFWVRARGTAWTRVDADFELGGILTARLSPSCSLQVELDPDRGPACLMIRLRMDGGTAFVSMNAGENSRKFESLRRGPIEAVLFDDTYRPARELARRAVDLDAGQVTVVRF